MRRVDPLLRRALWIWIAYAALHLCGLRADTAVLSGTSPTGDFAVLPALGGVVYLVAYFAAVVAAPILALASLALTAYRRATARGNGA